MSQQQENSDRSEKKNKREKKNKADTKYNKTPEEKEILHNMAEEWKKEPYRSPNKELICKKYLAILLDHGFNYDLQELKEYCNNHRKPLKAGNNLQGNYLPLNQPLQSLPDQAYTQKEMLNQINGTPNQNYFQQQIMNSMQQLPNQQYQLNPTFLQQQKQPQNLITAQTQQPLPYNQAFPSQQSFQQLPNPPFPQELPQQKIVQPPLSDSYSQKNSLHLPPTQMFLQQTFNSTPNQQYRQAPTIQSFQSVPDHPNSQQALQPQSNQIYSQQQTISSQTYSQQQPFSNQTIQQQPLAEQLRPQQNIQLQNEQRNQLQQDQQSSSQLDQNQLQPSLVTKTTPQSPNNRLNHPVSPEMSEIQLPSDSMPFSPSIFLTDTSQNPSRTNSIGLEANTSNFQTQNTSAQVQNNVSDIGKIYETNNEDNAEKADLDNESSNLKNKNEDFTPQNIRTDTNNNEDNEYNADGKDDNDETDSEDDDENSNNENTNQKSPNEIHENSKNDEKKNDLVNGSHGGKQVGKYYYYPPDTNFSSSSSSSSPYSVSISGKFQSSADKKVSDDEFINQLPDVPMIKGELNEANLDSFKNDLYNCIKLCYKYIHEASSNYNQQSGPNGEIIFNEKLFNFQKEVEKRMNIFTKLLSEILHIYQIGSHDKHCSHIELISRKYILSTTTRIYSGESYSGSGFPSRANSEVSDSSASQSGGNDDNSNNNSDMSDCTVTSYISNIKRLNVNEKLSSFYTGKYNEESRYSIDIEDVEASTIISYTYKPPEGDDDEIMICEYAYVNYYFNSHVLNVKEVKCETGFFRPVTAMHFHHFDDGSNKIYLCGDVRVKEFTISGLETQDQDKITIQNTNTFYFGLDGYQSSVITIWEDQLVLAIDSRIFFWNINDDLKLRKNKDTIETKANKSLVKQSGIDASKIDWTRGKNSKSSQISINTSGLNRITSLCILGENGNTFLAVASYNYPVIYIYNKKLQNVSRLVAHTMGVTCLKSINFQLFSGSLDLVARLWDTNKGMPILNVNTRCERITALDSDTYCDKSILLTGGEDHAIQCFSITDKKTLFEIKLNDNLVPSHISFTVGYNKEIGNHAKLMIISDCESRNCLTNFKKCQVHYFEFI